MVTLLNPGNHQGKAVSRGAFPKVAQSLYLEFDFSADNTFQVDLPVSRGIVNQIGLDGAQSIQIDNSDNASIAQFVFSNGYRLTVPPYSSAIFPLFVEVETLKFNAISAGGVLVRTWLLNTREMPAIWSTRIPIAGTVNVTGSVIYSTPTPGAFVDASAALAVGGVDEELIPADGNRIALVIKNPATPTGQGIAAPEPVYINFGGPAAIGGLTSIELLPGETITAANLGLCSTQSVHWIATTIGHQISCKVA